MNPSEIMQEETAVLTAILEGIDRPVELEALYRRDKAAFERAFASLPPEALEHPVAQAWQARLSYRQEAAAEDGEKDWRFLLVAIAIAGLVLKLPKLLSIAEDSFYARNIGFAVFPMLCAYFAWKNGLPKIRMAMVAGVFAVLIVYINILPWGEESDSTSLAFLHLPLFLWSVLGFTYLGDGYREVRNRISFLRYSADLTILSALLVIAGVIFTAITFGLFKVIEVDISSFYTDYVITFGAPAIPILGTYLVRRNPALVNRISPVIAWIFTPLVLVMLASFLIAMGLTEKDPYKDRDFLLVFNIMLIGVMAIILFSVSEAVKGSRSRLQLILLSILSTLTVIVNGIAISAIAFRLYEYGLTPNRLAVLGSNLLIMSHLLLVTARLYAAVKHRQGSAKVEDAIAFFLPAYAVWTLYVVVGFPLTFGFK